MQVEVGEDAVALGGVGVGEAEVVEVDRALGRQEVRCARRCLLYTS